MDLSHLLLALIVGASSLSAAAGNTIERSVVFTGPDARESTAVAMVDNAFMPASLTVQVGDTVTWTNRGMLPHTTTSDAGTWDSRTMRPGASFPFTFSQPGTYPYVCVFHAGLGMRGTITVVAPTATPPPPVVPPASPTATPSPPPPAPPPPVAELWLVVFAPTQAYSVTDDPLWVSQPGEWYRILLEESGWALAVWESDPPEWAVWIELDQRVQLTRT